MRCYKMKDTTSSRITLRRTSRDGIFPPPPPRPYIREQHMPCTLYTPRVIYAVKKSAMDTRVHMKPQQWRSSGTEMSTNNDIATARMVKQNRQRENANVQVHIRDGMVQHTRTHRQSSRPGERVRRPSTQTGTCGERRNQRPPALQVTIGKKRTTQRPVCCNQQWFAGRRC